MKKNCNCIICAKEFALSDMQILELSKINTTKFKICKKCFELSDPEDDYKVARDIVQSYLDFPKKIKNDVDID